MARGSDPITTGIPLPRGLLEIAKDFKAAIADARRELESVNRQIASQRDIAGKAGVAPELREQRENLLEQVRFLQEKQTSVEVAKSLKSDQAATLQAYEKNVRASAEAQRSQNEKLYNGIQRAVGGGQRMVGQAMQRIERGITLSDISSAGGMLERQGAELFASKNYAAGMKLMRMGAAVGASLAVGGMVLAGVEAYTSEQGRFARAVEASASVDMAVYRNFLAPDIYGTRFTSEFERGIVGRVRGAGETAGMQATGAMDALWSWAGMGSGRYERMARAKGAQAGIEQFALSHGESWRGRLSMAGMMKDPAVLRTLEWEESPAFHGFAGLMTKVQRDVIPNLLRQWFGVHVDPREARLQEMVQERIGKTMTAAEASWREQQRIMTNRPEYILASTRRNLYLREWTDYQHTRYMQWNPY